MRKPLVFGAIVLCAAVVLQFLGGFHLDRDMAFLGTLLVWMGFLWFILILGLKGLPPTFGKCTPFAIFLAMCAGGLSQFLYFDTACVVWALAFTIWLVAEMAMAFHAERKGNRN